MILDFRKETVQVNAWQSVQMMAGQYDDVRWYRREILAEEKMSMTSMSAPCVTSNSSSRPFLTDGHEGPLISEKKDKKLILFFRSKKIIDSHRR